MKRFFSADYAEARRKFLAAAALAGAETGQYVHPCKGPKGEDLFTDIAWCGPEDATRVMVVLSGTHGVEGFCGSGVQTAWLVEAGGADLPQDVGCLLVHAVNPYGFAWLRRVTEDGVDLNRNFIDHGRPPPRNPVYDELAEALIPRSLTGEIAAAANEKLAQARQRLGELTLMRSIAGGQFRHPGGLFYGGVRPTWSNLTTQRIIREFLSKRRRVIVVDLHSGLGPYGYGELLVNYTPGSPGAARAIRIWGESVATSLEGETLPFVEDGPTHYGYHRALTDVELTFGTLEFGTFGRRQGFRALQGDHWLHLYGDPLGPDAERIKAALRRQYYPATADWCEAVEFRAGQIIRMAIASLGVGRAD